MTEIKDIPGENKYEIFQALSHPVRVRILSILKGGEGRSFSSLKHELGMESSGQLQHHLQKLSGLISDEGTGDYRLTPVGVRALEIFRESENSGSSLKELCCLPAQSEIAHDHQISKLGILLRLSIGSFLTALTAIMVGNLLISGELSLRLGWASLSIGDALVFGFFGASFLVSAFTGYPGCEITAIPNLFTTRKRYCSCVITPFNVPNGRLIRRDAKE